MDKKLFNRQRILLLAHLRANGRTRFSVLKKELRFPSDGNLAWHIKVLENIGYVRSVEVQAPIRRGHQIEVHIEVTKKGLKALEKFGKFVSVLIPTTATVVTT